MIDGINETTSLIIGIGAALTILGGIYKVLWHGKRDKAGRRVPGLLKAFLRDLRGFRDVILGDEGVVDPATGGVIRAGQPGIGTRLANQEAQMSILIPAVAQIAETHARVENHEGRLSALEDASVERVVARVESTAGWRAMEAATNATPSEETPPTSS